MRRNNCSCSGRAPSGRQSDHSAGMPPPLAASPHHHACTCIHSPNTQARMHTCMNACNAFTRSLALLAPQVLCDDLHPGCGRPPPRQPHARHRWPPLPHRFWCAATQPLSRSPSLSLWPMPLTPKPGPCIPCCPLGRRPPRACSSVLKCWSCCPVSRPGRPVMQRSRGGQPILPAAGTHAGRRLNARLSALPTLPHSTLKCQMTPAKCACLQAISWDGTQSPSRRP